jgi:hypothetical protein
MLKLPALDRRTVLLGGIALPLAGCDPVPGGGPAGNNGPEPWISPEVVEAVATIALLATAAQFVGTIAGVSALVRLAGLVRNGASIIRVVDAIDRMINRRVSFAPPLAGRGSPLEWLIPPAHAGAISAGGTPPPPVRQPGDDISRVAFLSGTTEIQIAARNDTAEDFLAHNVYSTVRPVSWPAPTSVDELTGSTALPSFVMSMPAGGTFSNALRVNLPVEQGFLVYSWCVPTGTELDMNIVMNNAMVGPILFNCDPYDQAMLEAVQSQTQSAEPPVITHRIST